MMVYLLLSLLLVLSGESYAAPELRAGEKLAIVDEEFEDSYEDVVALAQTVEQALIAPVSHESGESSAASELQVDEESTIVDEEFEDSYEDVVALEQTVDEELIAPVSYEVVHSGKDVKLYEILGRLEQLQQEMQELRGRVEAQAYVIEQFGSLRRPSESRTVVSSLATSTGFVSADLEDKFSSGTNDVTTDKPEESISDNVGVSENLPPQSHDGLRALLPEPWLSPNGVLDTEELDFQQAYGVLRNGFAEYAADLFQAYLTAYPDGQYADQAQFWLAEAYLVNQMLELADQSFESLILKYPSSSQIPVALLKRSYLAVEQNEIDKARVFLTQVTISYPGSTAGHLAAKKLVELKNTP
ncbi:MAG: tetratricopeptide repeat protein [Methylococcales bacterium]|nr:tetratricopeptide repeat protein [Methylococcales bacterium]